MNGNFTITSFLRDFRFPWPGFTVFALLVLIPFHQLQASPGDAVIAPALAPTSNAQYLETTPLDDDNQVTRTHQLIDYVRNVGPSWVPGLPSYIRDPGKWAMGNVRAMRSELGLEKTEAGENPLAVSVTETPFSANNAMWLAPDYHHMGFLPTHDAMVMGVGARHAVFNSGTQLEVRPFYGQNWHSLEDYSGAEAALNISGMGLGDGKPWGRIAVRYVEGSDNMLDQGHGTDMHAEMTFNSQLALHAGVRETDGGELGNYALLRWQLAKFGTALQ